MATHLCCEGCTFSHVERMVMLLNIKIQSDVCYAPTTNKYKYFVLLLIGWSSSHIEIVGWQGKNTEKWTISSGCSGSLYPLQYQGKRRLFSNMTGCMCSPNLKNSPSKTPTRTYSPLLLFRVYLRMKPRRVLDYGQARFTRQTGGRRSQCPARSGRRAFWFEYYAVYATYLEIYRLGYFN